jgi:hypothetical protein
MNSRITTRTKKRKPQIPRYIEPMVPSFLKAVTALENEKGEDKINDFSFFSTGFLAKLSK